MSLSLSHIALSLMSQPLSHFLLFLMSLSLSHFPSFLMSQPLSHFPLFHMSLSLSHFPLFLICLSLSHFPLFLMSLSLSHFPLFHMSLSFPLSATIFFSLVKIFLPVYLSLSFSPLSASFIIINRNTHTHARMYQMQTMCLECSAIEWHYFSRNIALLNLLVIQNHCNAFFFNLTPSLQFHSYLMGGTGRENRHGF